MIPDCTRLCQRAFLVSSTGFLSTTDAVPETMAIPFTRVVTNEHQTFREALGENGYGNQWTILQSIPDALIHSARRGQKCTWCGVPVPMGPIYWNFENTSITSHSNELVSHHPRTRPSVWVSTTPTRWCGWLPESRSKQPDHALLPGTQHPL